MRGGFTKEVLQIVIRNQLYHLGAYFIRKVSLYVKSNSNETGSI